jgi:hypothetical protein
MLGGEKRKAAKSREKARLARNNPASPSISMLQNN